MRSVGTYLIVIGIGLVLFGLWLRLRFPWRWLGRLPGDIVVRRGNFTLYFPLVTGLLLSLVLSLLIFLIIRLTGRR
jgi:hypothetical protein